MHQIQLCKSSGYCLLLKQELGGGGFPENPSDCKSALSGVAQSPSRTNFCVISFLIHSNFILPGWGLKLFFPVHFFVDTRSCPVGIRAVVCLLMQLRPIQTGRSFPISVPYLGLNPVWKRFRGPISFQKSLQLYAHSQKCSLKMKWWLL